MIVKEIKLELDQASSALKLLGDQTRLTMLKLLEETDFCVCEFVEIFGISQPSVSQHVRKLKALGLVEENRKGRWVFYSLQRNGEVAEMVGSILKMLPDQSYRIEELKNKGTRVDCGE